MLATMVCRCGLAMTPVKSVFLCEHCDTPCKYNASICPRCRTIAKTVN